MYNPELAGHFAVTYATLREHVPPEERQVGTWDDDDGTVRSTYSSCCVQEFKGYGATGNMTASEFGPMPSPYPPGQRYFAPATREEMLGHRLYMGIGMDAIAEKGSPYPTSAHCTSDSPEEAP